MSEITKLINVPSYNQRFMFPSGRNYKGYSLGTYVDGEFRPDRILEYGMEIRDGYVVPASLLHGAGLELVRRLQLIPVFESSNILAFESNILVLPYGSRWTPDELR